ncbi:MAG: helix-turn-helix domain-containing protein, partial [Opitutaceae bacterium]
MDYPIKTPQQLGAVLKGFRRERKLTQSAAGASVGLPQNAISEMETNPGPASLARIFKLIAALDLELVVRSRTPPPNPTRDSW